MYEIAGKVYGARRHCQQRGRRQGANRSQSTAQQKHQKDCSQAEQRRDQSDVEGRQSVRILR